jgi:transposase-like protein
MDKNKCKHCYKPFNDITKNIYSGYGDKYKVVAKGIIVSGYDIEQRNVNYCPACGRELEVEDD